MQSNTIRSRTASLTWLVGISTLLAMSDGAAAGDLTLAGDVTNPGSYTISELQSLPSTTESVTIGGVTSSYTGVSLWTFLGDGPGPNPPGVIMGTGKNPSLRNYIVATGSNGSQSLVSLGEINPSFGNPPQGSLDLIAYKQNGSLLSSPQLIVPQDTSVLATSPIWPASMSSVCPRCRLVRADIQANSRSPFRATLPFLST